MFGQLVALTDESGFSAELPLPSSVVKLPSSAEAVNGCVSYSFRAFSIHASIPRLTFFWKGSFYSNRVKNRGSYDISLCHRSLLLAVALWGPKVRMRNEAFALCGLRGIIARELGIYGNGQ